MQSTPGCSKGFLREAAYKIRDGVGHRQGNGAAPDEESPSGFLTQLDLWIMSDMVGLPNDFA